jgi:hypothetical protein
VADDGSVAFAVGSALQILADGHRTDIATTGSGALTALAWSPDGQLLAAWHGSTHTLYGIGRGEARARWTASVSAAGEDAELRISDDNRYVVLSSKSSMGAQVALTTAAGQRASIDWQARPLLRWGYTKQAPPLDRSWLPQDGSMTTSKRMLLAATAGVVQLYEFPSWKRHATLVPMSQGRVVVLFADGRFDWLGEPSAPPSLLCLRDTAVVSPSVCNVLLDRGTLPRHLARGSPAELPPCPRGT